MSNQTPWLKLFSLTIFGTLLSPQSQAAPPKPTLKPKIENQYHFVLDRALLNQGTPQYYSRLLLKKEAPLNTPEFSSIVGIDFPGYYRNRGNDDYAVMLGRVVFTIPKPIEFYSGTRLTDVNRMNRLMPEFPARRDPSRSGSFFSDGYPGCKFTVETWSRDELLALGNSRPELRYAEKMNPELGVPDRIVIQHNFDFERVLGFKTSRGALTLTAHYADGPNRTLISTFSLGYLENLPPAVWGGAGIVTETSRDATLVLIERLRKE